MYIYCDIYHPSSLSTNIIQYNTFYKQSISKEINCAEQEYMNMSPPLIELAAPLYKPTRKHFRF